MENRINVAELLKNCPKGMELDCSVYNNVTLEYVVNSSSLPICIRIQDRGTMFLSRYGQLHDESCCKCIIFPKGKTTWEGFVPPCKFKDGDIITNSWGTCIFKGEGEDEFKGTVHYYCGISHGYFSVKDDKCNPNAHYGYIVHYRLSTEEEKQKLFAAIKENGYKWNKETKTLEKLVEPQFKVGDSIKRKVDTRLITIKAVRDNDYIITFKDGFGHAYITDTLSFSNQDEYELIPNKFDINTLKPFDKVLVKSNITNRWIPSLFGYLRSDDEYPYAVIGGVYWRCCIPYEGNEHLLDTTDDCDEYYKTWEK